MNCECSFTGRLYVDKILVWVSIICRLYVNTMLSERWLYVAKILIWTSIICRYNTCLSVNYMLIQSCLSIDYISLKYWSERRLYVDTILVWASIICRIYLDTMLSERWLYISKFLVWESTIGRNNTDPRINYMSKQYWPDSQYNKGLSVEYM